MIALAMVPAVARPETGTWKSYIAGPQTRLVPADSVEFTHPGNGSITGPQAAITGDGVSATLIRTASPSPELAIDFGLPVSGKIEIVFGDTVDAPLGIAFSQRLEFLHIGSDTTAWCLGDLSVRGRPGITWRSDARRGFRYVLLYLPENGAVSIDAVRVYHTPMLGTPDTYDGHFLCNDDLLNRIWYGCIYTQEICTSGGYGCDGPWEIEEGWMSVSWDQEHSVGLSVPGNDWTDSTLEFDVMVMPLGRAAAWCFRASDPMNTYAWRIVTEDGIPPSRLQKLIREDGNWNLLGETVLPLPVREGETHHVRTDLSGTTIRTSIDGRLVDTTTDTTFPRGRIGFAVDPAGDHFHVDNVVVSSSSGTLFSDDFSGEFQSLDPGKWECAEFLTILDGAKRDRLWYLGDLFPAQRATFSAHWLPSIVADTLRDAAEHQLTAEDEARFGKIVDGKIPSSNVHNYTRDHGTWLILDDYSLWWVLTLHDYWIRTGDETILADTYPALERLFDRWAARKHDDAGLLTLLFGDWYWSFTRTGAITSFNALYAESLRRGAQIATALGRDDDAARWSDRAATVKAAVNDLLFDATEELYVDGRDDFVHHPLDANTLTILFDIASEDRARRILDRVEERMWSPLGTVPSWPGYDTWGHNDQIWAWYVQYEADARFQLGDDLRAFELIRRLWGHMVDSDPGKTMWEFMMADGTVEDGTRNTDHAFSAGAAWLLSEYAAGIRPTSPGFATLDIIPHPGRLEWVQCSVPSPRGPVGVEYSIGPSRDTFSATFTIPERSVARFGVPRLGETGSLTLDGEKVWPPPKVPAEPFSDDSYIFTPFLPPGTHSTEAAFTLQPTPTPSAPTCCSFFRFY